MNRVDNNNSKNKRVWVPYNKKLKLKGMQQSMQGADSRSRMQPLNHHGSYQSGNPLLNSNDWPSPVDIYDIFAHQNMTKFC